MFVVQSLNLNPGTVPFEVEYQEPSRFSVRASGEVTLPEIEALFAEILAHPGLSTGTDMIVEADDVEAVPPTEDLRAVASLMVPMLKKGFAALAIVSKNPFIYGVARVFSVFAETVGAKVSAFRKAEDANKWLANRRQKKVGAAGA